MMARLTIRTRLMLLTCAGLFVLIATNAYLTKKLAENSAGMVTAAELLKSIEEANSAQIAFGELRYWMTDLAVSQLTMAERNAAAARARVEQHLDELQPWNPQRIATVRSEIAQYEDLAGKAVEEYTDDRRVIGNSLLAQARQHSLVADQLIASIVQELTGAAIAARQRVVAEADTATRLSQIVVAAAVVIGSLLTFLVLRSIVVPLRRLTVAMDGPERRQRRCRDTRGRPGRDRRDRADPGALPRHPEGTARDIGATRGIASGRTGRRLDPRSRTRAVDRSGAGGRVLPCPSRHDL